MADISCTVFQTVLPLFKDPLARNLLYTFKSKALLEELEEKLKQLNGQKENLQHEIEAGIRSGEKIEGPAESWQDRSKEIVKVTSAFLDKTKHYRSSGCCFGCSGPNLMKQRELGKEAHKKSQEIDSLLQEKNRLGRLTYCRSFQPIVTLNRFEAQSRTQTLNVIIGHLKDQEIKKLGIYGARGIGKTTMVNDLLRQAKQLEFRKIVMATVSASPEIFNLQLEIAGQLDMDLKSMAETVRASRLHYRLKNDKKILIILDDLWHQLDLTKIGIPDEGDLNESKIVLLSRRKKVLEDMDSWTNVDIARLTEDEAMSLFQFVVKEVRHPVQAKEIVEKCFGHPLYITKLGVYLRNQELHAWDDVLTRLPSGVDDTNYDRIASALGDRLQLSHY